MTIELPDLFQKWAFENLASILPPPGMPILIDGWTGLGKSTITNAIVRLPNRIGSRVLSIDSYIVPDRNFYFDALNLPLLRRDIAACEDGEFILEGVQCLRLAEELQLSEYCLIYLQEWNPTRNTPSMEELFDEAVTSREILEEDRESRANVLVVPDNALFEELVEYSKKYHPWKRADHIIRVTKDTGG